MKKLIAIPLSVIAVATLGACASRPADTFPRASIAPQPVAYHAGTGTITQVAASPSYYGGNDAGRTAPATSSAGGSAGANIGIARPSTAYNRLTIRMDDGKTMQYLDTDSNEFRPGMRVELLPDHTIKML
jgi:outer membrane lipoprotein SlyB